MGPLGWQETIFIFVLALLIFGPKKLPELGKTIGKAMTEFRRASSELRSTWDREMATMEHETESFRNETRKIEGEISSAYHDGTDHYSSYDSGYEYGGTGTESIASTTTPAADSQTVGEAAVQAAEQTALAPEPAVSTSVEAASNATSGNAPVSTAAAVATEVIAPAETHGKDVRA